MKFIARIQQKELGDKTLPYPYFIGVSGLVGRQDFWKGKPHKLLGFHDKPDTGDINLPFEEFKLNIKKAIGMYPVFEHKETILGHKGTKWVTHTNPVEFIEV